MWIGEGNGSLTNADPFEDARIFFLGAGFSAAAGIPLTNSLLPRAAELFQDAAPGLFERISGYADDIDVNLSGQPNAEDFARLCTYLHFIELREHGGGERWSADGSRERLALKFYLSKAIAFSTPTIGNIPQMYRDFANDISGNDVIITFNSDVLLEQALDAMAKPYSYAWEAGKTLILKLHGSVNWVNGHPRAMGYEARDFAYQPIGFATDMAENEVYFSDILRDQAEWTYARALVDQVKPLIVLPGYGKILDVRLLSAIWYRPEFLNLRRGGISIIGLSVADDDYIVDSLLRYLFRSVFEENTKMSVLNPDPMVEAKFRKIISGIPFDFHCEKFADETIKLALLHC